MKVLIAIDSFKGSLSSSMANKTVKTAFDKVFGNSADVIDLADGGEGTLEAFKRSLDGTYKHITVHNAVSEKIEARYLTFEKDKALIELAEAAGLSQLSKEERNPLHTTTLGVGELFKDAVQNGAKHLYIGLGGSATNDGGIGFLKALGIEFLDEKNLVLKPTGGSLGKIHALRNLESLKAYENVTITLLCDVNNPLNGPNGASFVYGPQKGARGDSLKILDAGLSHYASVVKVSEALKKKAGMGAAGGFPLSLVVFLDAHLKSGFDALSDLVHLKTRMEKADLIITGEGTIDPSTLNDKGPFKIGMMAHSLNKPVIAFGGAANLQGKREAYPFDAVFSIMNGPMSLEDALDKTTAKKSLYFTATEVAKIMKMHL